jgi:hypothetical protein
MKKQKKIMVDGLPYSITKSGLKEIPVPGDGVPPEDRYKIRTSTIKRLLNPKTTNITTLDGNPFTVKVGEKSVRVGCSRFSKKRIRRVLSIIKRKASK